MFESHRVIRYPDPRLKQVSKPVENFDDKLNLLVARMLELMREQRGVGLAAPQIGVSQRVFVMNHTGNPEDDRVYINPQLFDLAGTESAEEGCLSLPNINAMIDRAVSARIVAKDLHGKAIDQTDTGYVVRIWQHEFDHLNGILITDRMGEVARMMHRKTLRELESEYEAARKKTK